MEVTIGTPEDVVSSPLTWYFLGVPSDEYSCTSAAGEQTE